MPKSNGKDTPELADREGALDPDVAGDEAGLSAEEAAALAEDDAGENDQAGVGDDDEGGDSDTPAPLRADADEPAEPAVEDADSGPSDDDEDRGQAPNVRVMPEVDVAEVDAKLGEVKSQIAELDKAYDDGELDFAEYRQKERELADQQANLIADKREAELAIKVNTEAASRTWEDNVARFMSENQMFATKTGQAALNGALQDLYADEKNLTASHDWLLNKAASMVRADMGIDVAPVAGETAAEKAARERAKKSADARNKLPRTLGDTPVADEPDTSADEFSSLDSLQGLELEAAVARMTPEQQERFAKG
jgi:hypothetical protein